jgi:N-methylhydantoinase A
MALFVGTDVGGTFTDLWVSDASGDIRVFKSPTTADVKTGVIDVLKIAAEDRGISFEAFCSDIVRFGHGTTVGLNALLTGRAARTAVLTTQGFGDTLEIGRMRRQTSGQSEAELTDFTLRNRNAPIVPRRLVFEIDERVDSKGTVIKALDETQARTALTGLTQAGVEAVAICLLWSTANPAHELALRDIVTEIHPKVFVCLSHVLSPLVGEYGRMSTTAANAALGPIAGRYLEALEETLQSAGMRVPLLMMTNAGGVLPTAAIGDRPAFALFSGPAAGVVGSAVMGRKLGLSNVLTSDIGGTSFDVGIIAGGKPILRREVSVGGADIRVPSIDVESIGAGGGSIASVRFGQLTVGPMSAGANPGPVCYGRGGTEPTVTDADLLLGILDADNFIGGRMRLDADAAARAMHDKIARPLATGTIEAAWGVREVIDSKMADLLRRMTIQRGYDPREFTLFANGGAGPSHAWAFARELGLRGFVVPAAATAQSAYGCGNADLGVTKESAVYLRVGPGAEPDATTVAAIDTTVRTLEEEAKAELVRAGAQGEIAVERLLAVRFRGQSNVIDVILDAARFDASAYTDLTKQFESIYEALFGRGASYGGAGHEIVSARAIARGVLQPPAARAQGTPLESAGTRRVVFDDPAASLETAIYKTRYPAPDVKIDGPAIIEFPGQSVVVPPRGSATADEFGNLHVSIEP